ncbi:unnamed protein product [Clonostachys rosea]|uniref:Enoyl reductase (ER) domain-containing protein n=1 Tax=Bionectria ochroleuca TaxID=29856 RepID=A0ABY6U6I7_BIOOC|nr:unnamed protein product [Clonostachys rosea]
MSTATTSSRYLSELPHVQQAFVQDSEGRPILIDNAPLPVITLGTVLVKTAAVGLNPSDVKIPKRYPAPGAVCGLDYAGVIVRMDNEAARLRPDLKIGDSVCSLVHGSNPADSGNGSFAEYISAPAQLVIKVPKGLSLNQASALGVALATNCLALWDCLAIPGSPSSPSPESFDALVYGGSTCFGTMAIQLLKLSGARVITTCSPRSFDLVKDYGADLAFDYAESSAPEAVRTLTKNRLRYALDCIADQDSASFCYMSLGSQVLDIRVWNSALRASDPERRESTTL